LIDGTPATLTAGIDKGFDAAAHQDWETIHTLGTGIIAGLASTVNLSSNAASATETQVTSNDSQTVGQQLSFAVTAGGTYTVTKYVGVVTAPAAASAAAAQQQSAAAAAAGFDGTLGENTAAWQALWGTGGSTWPATPPWRPTSTPASSTATPGCGGRQRAWTSRPA
jgi:trehalose/maltose hydrolase-like predicted phosphorylase